MRFEIGVYHKDQTGATFPLPYCKVHKLTHNEKFMGEDYVMVNAELPVVADPNNSGRNYFMVGDWLEYRGIRYVIDVPPTIQKSARVNRRGNSISYDSVKFINKLCLDLMYLEFRDVTNGTEHYNFAARTFTFYCASLYNFAEKIKANIDRRHAGEYRVYVHATDGNNYLVGGDTTMPSGVTAVGKDNITVSASDQKCWDALSHVKEDFDVNFIVAKDDDDVLSLFLGCNGKLLSQQHFSYGRGNGLFKLERTTDDSQAIVTRLRAYGAETNMPTRYYKNVNIRYYVEASASTIESIGPYYATGADRVSAILGEKDIVITTEERNALYLMSGGAYNVYYMPTLKRSMFKNVSETTSMAEVTIGEDYPCRVFAPVGSDTTLQTAVFLFTKDTSAKNYIANAIGTSGNIYFSGGINKGSWSVSGMIADATNLPNNMNVKCLMLPGFGQRSLYDVVEEAFSTGTAANIRVLSDYYDTNADNNGFDNFLAKYSLSQDLADPWIEAVAQVDAYGMREGYAVFDDGNEDYDPIYPSLQNVGGDTNLLPAQSWTAGGETYNNNLRVDNGIVDDLASAGMEIPQWYLYVKDPGFDPYEQRKEGESSITVHIKDGMVGGRDFTCHASSPITLSDGTNGYRLTLDRVEDSSLDLYFPYRASGAHPVDFVPKEGDEIVYLNIEMPDEYVERTALYELLPAALETLDENCDVRYKFNLTIDKERMARQHYAAMQSGEEESLHDTMRAGDVLVFGDTDLGVSYNEGIAEDADTITAAILIESVEIKENEGALPEYSISLVDQETISSIDKMQKQIDSIVSGSISISTSGGGGGGYSAAEIQGLIKTYGNKWFLSRLKTDSAAGLISFLKGVNLYADTTTGIAMNCENSLDEGVSGCGIWKDASGNWHLQADYLRVNKKLMAIELEIEKMSHIGGSLVLSAARSTFSDVEVENNIATCYFPAVDEDGTYITNDWKVGDQARVQTFNLVDENGVTSNRYWWRVVESTGTTEDGSMHYVTFDVEDLEANLGVKYDTDSDIPQAGDVAVLLGSRYDDANRTNVIIIDSAGEGSPYIKIYNGITTFSLGTPRIDLNATDPRLDVSSLTITANGASKDVSEIVDESFLVWYVTINAPTTSGEINSVVELGNEYFPDGEEGWTSDDYAGHLGDVALTADGVCYRFEEYGGSYAWVRKADDFLIQALQTANESKATLTNMASDDVITKQEKVQMENLRKQIVAERTQIIAEANTFNVSRTVVSTVNYQSAYNALKAFLDYFLASPNADTTLINSSGYTLFAEEQATIFGQPSTYTISYVNRSSGIAIRGCEYSGAVSDYYTQYTLLRKNITSGMRSEIQSASESGYDAEINAYVGELINRLPITSETSGTFTVTELTSLYNAISSWEWDYSNNPSVPTINGAGLLTTSNFASLWADVWEDDEQKASAILSAFCTQTTDAQGNSVWVSTIGISATYLVVDTTNFKLDANGTMIATNGSFSGTICADEGGTIGGWYIGANQIGGAAGGAQDTDGMTLFDDFIVFNKTNRQSIIGTWDSYSTPILARFTDTSTTDLVKYGVAINISGGQTPHNNIALDISAGICQGIKHRTDRISSNVTLTKAMHNVLVITSDAITITLPSNMEDGTEFRIFSYHQTAITIATEGGEQIRWTSLSATTTQGDDGYSTRISRTAKRGTSITANLYNTMATFIYDSVNGIWVSNYVS